MSRGAAGGVGRLRVPRPGRVRDTVIARLRRPGIERETTESILGAYGRRPTGPVENLPFGWRNRSVVLRTSAGRMVLKRYRDGWEERTIEHEHSIIRHLETVGFRAVRLEETPSGETLVEHGGARFALFAYEVGVNPAGFVLPPRRRERLWRDAGRVLAGFHAAVAGFIPRGRHHLGFQGASEERERDLAWHRRSLERLVRDPGPIDGPGTSGTARWLAANAGRIGERIATLDQTLARASLTRSVIHGDPGIHNVLVGPDGAFVLHDFELSRIEWRLVDLAIVLSRADPRAGHAFLAGYDDASPDRSPEERGHLIDVWEHYRLCGAVQSWVTFARLGDDRRLTKARARVEEADLISEAGLPALERSR